MSDKPVNSRPRGIGLVVVFQTVISILRSFRKNKMTSLLPLVIVLLLFALLLAVCALIAPIAPFVYPLF